MQLVVPSHKFGMTERVYLMRKNHLVRDFVGVVLNLIVLVFLAVVVMKETYSFEVPLGDDELILTGLVHQKDGRIFFEVESGGLFFCYWVDREQLDSIPETPIDVRAWQLAQGGWDVPCAYKTVTWYVAVNRNYRTAPVYERALVDGKRVKLKDLNGNAVRALIGKRCGDRTYFPSTNGTEYHRVVFGQADGTVLRGVARCAPSLE